MKFADLMLANFFVDCFNLYQGFEEPKRKRIVELCNIIRSDTTPRDRGEAIHVLSEILFQQELNSEASW